MRCLKAIEMFSGGQIHAICKMPSMNMRTSHDTIQYKYLLLYQWRQSEVVKWLLCQMITASTRLSLPRMNLLTAIILDE